MKKQFQKLSAAALAATLLLTASSGAFACTGVYVGKKASADGTTIIARSEDIGAVYDKLETVVPASDEVGRFMTDINGFSYPLPDHTYKYTQMEDYADGGDGVYAAVCVNEMGVAVSGTVSASGCSAYYEVDPLVETGLREAILPALAAATSATAKEAVENLAAVVDACGSAEGNVVLIADQQEAWIMEFYGGKQYAAAKLAEDQVAVFGNHFMLGAVDPADTENFVVSEGLLSALETAGLTVKDENGLVLAAQSVCGGKRSAGNNLRNWGGMHLLAPSLAGEEFDVNTFYPLLYTPDEQVTLEDVFAVFRCRYEGTAYDLSLEGQEGNRAIAVSSTTETHVVQLYSDLPASSAAVTWLALSGAEHSVFVPQLSAVTELHPAYGTDAPTYSEDSAYWAFKKICGLADVNRALYTDGVQTFWENQESAYIEQMKEAVETVKTMAETDPDGIGDYANTLAYQALATAMSESDVLYGQLLTTLSKNSGSSRQRTFAPDLPLRASAVAKGYTVNWDEATPEIATLTKDGVSIEVSLVTDGAYIIDGITYVPASFVESL